jgi:transglutaminase-like putative cysteine protease
MTTYHIRHVTAYRYADPVAVSHQVIVQIPRSTPRQRVIESALDLVPLPATRMARHDWFGNEVTVVTVQEPHRDLTITATSTVEVDDPLAQVPSPAWEGVAERLLREDADPAVIEAVQPSPFVPIDAALAEFAREDFTPGRSLAEAAFALTVRIHAGFIYDPAATTIATPVAEVLHRRRGVCQDFAHLAIAALRSLGLAARYVSGYLETQPPPGQTKLRGADASHAWLSVWCPANGWIDLDPTNGCWVGSRHVTAAWGRDFGDVSPVKGVILGGGAHDIAVAVDVDPA